MFFIRIYFVFIGLLHGVITKTLRVVILSPPVQRVLILLATAIQFFFRARAIYFR